MTTQTAYIDSADVAKVIRLRLRNAFPTRRFAVKTSRYAGGSSIRVEWTDGPTRKEVEAHFSGLIGESFDGMIDLATDIRGTMTADLRCELMNARIKGDIPAEGVTYHSMASYIHAEREMSEPVRAAISAKIRADYGITDERPDWQIQVGGPSGMWLNMMVVRESERGLEEAA